MIELKSIPIRPTTKPRLFLTSLSSSPTDSEEDNQCLNEKTNHTKDDQKESE